MPGLAATPAFGLAEIEARASRDYAQLRLALGNALRRAAGSTEVASPDVAPATSEALGSAAGTHASPALNPDAGPADAIEEARAATIAAVRPHVWVQRQFGSEWLDLDPTLPAAQPGQPLVPATRTADALPTSLDHVVRIRLEEERLDGDALTTHPLLAYEAPAADAARSELFLMFGPLTDQLGGTIREVLTGDVEWYPTLMVDGSMLRGEPFQVSSSGTDLFGSSQATGPDLVGMRLVIETQAPDGTTREVERMLLDRVPPDQRASGHVHASALEPMPQDDGVPRFVAAIRHLMVSTGGANVRDYAQERYLAADYTGSTLIGATLADPPPAFGAVWPMAAADLSLVVASETAVVPALVDGSGARGFVGAPRVFLTTIGRDPDRDGSLAFSTDLALDGIDVLPGSDPASAARLRLWYGALQTALESRMALQRAALIDPGSRGLEGASTGASGDLRGGRPCGSAGRRLAGAARGPRGRCGRAALGRPGCDAGTVGGRPDGWHDPLDDRPGPRWHAPVRRPGDGVGRSI
ncbi:MAG: hypothetical protein R3C32_06320 [Chloroflexota bacterium]